MLNPDKIDIVIYHHPCSDGFTSAAIAYMYCTEKNLKIPEFIGVSYHNIPRMLSRKVMDKNVLACDFTFKRGFCDRLYSLAENMLILNNHKATQTELSHLSPSQAISDTNKSSATLTWEYFYPNQEIPLFIKYIEDNETCAKKLPMTNEVNYYINSMNKTFETYIEMIKNDELVKTKAFTHGVELAGMTKQFIKRCTDHSETRMVEIDGEIYFMAICAVSMNVKGIVDSIADALKQRFTMIDFSAIVVESNALTAVSLRGQDVDKIAVKYGGGGHRLAAGCDTLPGSQHGDRNSYDQLEMIDFSVVSQYKYAALNTSVNKREFVNFMKRRFYNCDFVFTWHYSQGSTWFCVKWNEEKVSFEKFHNFKLISKNMAEFSMIGLHTSPFE